MLGVTPGSFSSLRSEARFRSMGADAAGAWRRLKRLHAGATSAAASTRTASLAGAGIDLAPHDVVGHREVLLARLAARGAHEVGPDGEGSLRARESGRPAAVEPHPDARHHLGREADEPRVAGVVRGARLARGR